MPPTLTVPKNDQPTPLVPDPDTDTDSGGADGKIAGLTVVPARKLGRDAFNVLFYAYPGVGKTHLSGLFAEYEPAQDVLIVDAEGGASVLSHLDHVDVVQVKTWADVEKIMVWLERTPLEKIKYRTVCFDNMTEYHLMHLHSVTGGGAVEIQHYGMNTAAILRFTRRARDLSRFRGINTVLLAWQDSKEDKTRGITRQIVAMTDKLAARLPGVPNNVGYITILNNPPLYTRKISFAASPLNDAKFRRSSGDAASPIPDELYYGVDQNPIADILRTIYEGAPFPAARYVRPKGRGNVNTPAEPEAAVTT